MKSFMDSNFLLNNGTAQELYHEFAAKLPIIDYHCHINPQEIAEDINYKNITQVWLGGDHYKWRLMRAAGIDEEYITGQASDYDKFLKWADVLSKSIGNPVYHWSHLELRRYFGYNGLLNKNTAAEVWELCNKKLIGNELSARNIIRLSNVEAICTTDDPVDSLEWHQQIADDASFDVKVLPAWRPDNALNIESPNFFEYLDKLTYASGVKISTFADLKQALKNRMAFFAENGCRISDHALEYVYYLPVSDEDLELIFTKRVIRHEELTEKEILAYKTAFMLFLGKEYSQLGWVMQLHYGCKRNNNSRMFEILGADTGYDCINNYAPTAQLTDFLNALDKNNHLPKTILYSLNPQDNQMIDTIAGCFQQAGIVNKIQHGSAWWFNDHKQGMREQMIFLANIGYLAGFLGMLTDSRSMLSYPRHEYFRRILCDLLGEWVESGELPYDLEMLSSVVSDISYYNTKKYLNL